MCGCILGGAGGGGVAISGIEARGVSVRGLNTELIQLCAELLLALY